MGTGTGRGAIGGVGGGSEGKLVAAIVATVGDVDFRLDCARGDIHEFADSCRYLPVLGFAGGGDRRVRDGEKWGENLTSLRAETTFLILDL